MNITELKRIGYFDNIGIDGWFEPIYKGNGIYIHSGMTLLEAINFNDTEYSLGVGRLHVDIYGEVIELYTGEDEEIREARDRLKLCKSVKNKVDRYRIAGIDILIVKDEYAMPNGVYNIDNIEEDFDKLSSNTDELGILAASKMLSSYLSEKLNIDKSAISGAIVDRVYVADAFRKLGVSNWIHSNIIEIINTFGMTYPRYILLAYGDFKGEAEKRFNMTSKEYNDMLKYHYIDSGYKVLYTLLKTKELAKYPNIMYKINM